MTISDEQLVDRVGRVPQRIAQAMRGRTDTPAHPATGGEDAWSAAEIMAHLRASDDILAYRIYTILVRDDPPMPAYDERRWAEVAQYTAIPFQDSLAVFAAKRAELVRVLRHLAPADWDRQGIHEVHGPRTLRRVVTGLVEHEEEHCVQLETLGSQP